VVDEAAYYCTPDDVDADRDGLDEDLVDWWREGREGREEEEGEILRRIRERLLLRANVVNKSPSCMMVHYDDDDNHDDAS